VVTTTGTSGTVSQRGIATAPTYDANDNLTNGSWLPTMSAVENMVSGASPTGPSGEVATYLPGDNDTGVVGGHVAISSVATHSEATGELTNGNNIASVALVDGKQDKKVCYSREAGHENDDEYCLLWLLPD
ncbi:MAG: hypothetical protein II179_03345, partial [Alphaproteobacteria bacterium]|nr:hypothetical protein [Alphaproteobacteria bacterium]